VRELSLHLLDLLENSIEARATRIDLLIVEDTRQNRLTIAVEDDGRGMDAQTVSRVADPFYTTRTTRHVGLGIPLLKAAAERCNGSFQITSRLGVGTRVVAEFQWDHIDRAPLGDLPATLLAVILADRASDIHYVHRVDERAFDLNTAEMRGVLGDVPFSHPQVRAWLLGFIEEGYRELYQRSLEE
jgi:hypothetical protein